MYKWKVPKGRYSEWVTKSVEINLVRSWVGYGWVNHPFVGKKRIVLKWYLPFNIHWRTFRTARNAHTDLSSLIQLLVISKMHVWLVMCRLLVRAPSKAPVVSLSKKLYPDCLVLVGSRKGFERDFTIKLNWVEGLMVDWLKCQISPLIEYSQNNTPLRNETHECNKIRIVQP